MGDERDAATTDGKGSAAGRLRYEKPAVSWEQPLEVQPSLMSGCQKTPSGGADCTAVGPISS